MTVWCRAALASAISDHIPFPRAVWILDVFWDSYSKCWSVYQLPGSRIFLSVNRKECIFEFSSSLLPSWKTYLCCTDPRFYSHRLADYDSQRVSQVRNCSNTHRDANSFGDYVTWELCAPISLQILVALLLIISYLRCVEQREGMKHLRKGASKCFKLARGLESDFGLLWISARLCSSI